jgi:integron integrase
MKPGTSVLQSTRLLDQVRERIRYMHYSLKTEKAYLYWARFFIRWSATQPGGMRHPRDMGGQEVEAFLSMMANERKVSASTHNQALTAVLFLYREVLSIDLPWLNNIGRPQQSKRIPSVLTNDEVAGLLAQMDGISALLARLLYGTGMRLMEGMRLRVKDVDFERHAVIVREAKGNKDRVVMLPRSLAPALRLQMLLARALWEADRQAQRGGVEVPHALDIKYPKVGATWAWFWMFPSPTLSTDPRSGVERRHHLFEERLQRALKVAVPKAGIYKPVSVRTLRHSFATHLLQSGTDIRTVQELPRHSDASTTMVYTQVLKVAAGGTASPLDSIAFGP